MDNGFYVLGKKGRENGRLIYNYMCYWIGVGKK